MAVQAGIVCLTTSLAFSKIWAVLMHNLHGRSTFALLHYEAVPEGRPSDQSFAYRTLKILLLDQLFERCRRVLLRSPPDWEDLDRDKFPDMCMIG